MGQHASKDKMDREEQEVDQMEFNQNLSDDDNFRHTIRRKKRKSNSFRANNADGACFSCLSGHISQQNSHIENRRDIRDLKKSGLNKSFGGGTHVPEHSQMSQVSSHIGLATNHSDLDKNKPRSKSKYKKYRDSEPQTPLRNDGLYADIYQGMYDNMNDDENNQTADLNR